MKALAEASGCGDSCLEPYSDPGSLCTSVTPPPLPSPSTQSKPSPASQIPSEGSTPSCKSWPSQCFPLAPHIFHGRRRQEPRTCKEACAPARARLSHTTLKGQTQLSAFWRSTGWWVLQQPPLVPWLVMLLPAGEEGSRLLLWATAGTGQEEGSLRGAVLVPYSWLCVLSWGQLGQKVSVLQTFVFCRA